MLKNLFKIALRNIFKDFGYSFLNIMGLTIGIACSLFLILYISDELSYDRYHEKSDRIYRVVSHISEPDDAFTWVIAQIPFAPQAKQDYPEIKEAIRFIGTGRTLYKYDELEFYEDRTYFVDSAVFEVFSYNLIHGDPKTALNGPNKIVVTESFAQKYFGDEDPVGKSIVTPADNEAYKVTGIMQDVPGNSHFRFDALLSRSSLPEQMGSWGNFGVYTYLLLDKGVNGKELEKKMEEMYDNYMAEIFQRMGIDIRYELQPITDIHLKSNYSGEPEATGNIIYVYIFAAVALFLILVASMNYMNLATARSIKRVREVGLRKVVGSSRGSLIAQFLIESITFTIFALILSIIIVISLLPSFNNLAGKEFDLIVLLKPAMIVSALGIIVFVGIIGGSYPAFFLSRFNPLVVMKGELVSGSKGVNFRKILVVIQFVISVSMIISTWVVYNQLNYLRNKDQGYDMNNVVRVTYTSREMIQKHKAFEQSLLESPEILHVTNTISPVGQGSPKSLFRVETPEGMTERGINFTFVDHNFIPTLGIKILEGRNFQENIPADTLYGAIINETLAQRMNWEEPIGKKVQFNDTSRLNARVVGLIKDYHQTGMYNEVESLMFLYRLINDIVYIKIADNRQQALTAIEHAWNDVFPEQPFQYEFLEDTFNEQFEGDKNRGMIFSIFTLLTIIIACLGLFGLASYTVEQKTKEVGIRKVMGATETTIVKIISKEFLMLVFISILVAVPVSYYFMSDWLQNYVYRTDLSVTIFLLSGIIALLITLLTVSYHAYKAAITNPAETLRVE